VHDATPAAGSGPADLAFGPADLAAFCRSTSSAWRSPGNASSPPGRSVLPCRVVPAADCDERWCQDCGCEGVPRDSVVRRLAHEPFGWRPTTLLVTIRGYTLRPEEPDKSLTSGMEEHQAAGVLIRRERRDDLAAIHSVTAAAFRGEPHSAPPVEPGGDPGEVALLSRLRGDAAWIPPLSLVAIENGLVVGHVVCTRAHVDDQPALGLGPLSVLPNRQRTGIGSALMHAVLGAADALGERLVGLVGEPAYYHRFGFVPAQSTGVTAPALSWGNYFQVRHLTQYAGQTGRFRYAAPFDNL
jgi:putative acetyltransferase